MLQGRLPIISSPQTTTALLLGRLLNRSKQTSKRLREATTTPLHTSGNMKRLWRFFYRVERRYMPSSYVCLCVWVCLSVTLRYCSKMAKHRMTQIMPHDSTGNRFFDAKDHGEILTVLPPTWATIQMAWVKIGRFRQITCYNSKTV